MNTLKVAVLDYGIGNVKSIANAFNSLGVQVLLTKNEQEILAADVAILPGVGAFATGMENLQKNNLVNTIKAFVKTGKPFVGICLGMQMLMEESEEFGITQGLGLIKGKVIKLAINEAEHEKLPHVSWNEIKEPTSDRWQNTLLNKTANRTCMYFVHSFVASPIQQSDVLATCNYGGVNFCAAVQKDNVYGFQFHPEKSGVEGLEILRQLQTINQ